MRTLWGLLPKTKGQLHAVVAAGAQQHGAHVIPHGVWADAQLLADGFVAQALGHKAQNLLLSVRETHVASFLCAHYRTQQRLFVRSRVT